MTMIPREALGKIAYAGKTLNEVIQGVIDSGFTVEAEVSNGSLILNITQRIELPLGLDPALSELVDKAKELNPSTHQLEESADV